MASSPASISSAAGTRAEAALQASQVRVPHRWASVSTAHPHGTHTHALQETRPRGAWRRGVQAPHPVHVGPPLSLR